MEGGDKEKGPKRWQTWHLGSKIVAIRNMPLYVIMLGLQFSGQILPKIFFFEAKGGQQRSFTKNSIIIQC